MFVCACMCACVCVCVHDKSVDIGWGKGYVADDIRFSLRVACIKLAYQTSNVPLDV